MLRRTRYSSSLSAFRAEPVKKREGFQWTMIPDELFTEPVEDSEEYVQEWVFPYPGQKAFLMVGRNISVSAHSPLKGKGEIHLGRLRYPGQGVRLAHLHNPLFPASLKK